MTTEAQQAAPPSTVLPEHKLSSGIFLAPFHPTDDDPTLALRRDIELIEHLDRLGFEEAWIGEHHSAGYEIIASPELFIAAAAERTQRIRLGTGVVSLPYHHPLMVANRILQLDHMTRGRVMLGVGPGLLPSDARMLGIDVSTQRPRMNQSLEAILRLMRGEVVTERTDWYTLDEARCQLQPYTWPHPEVAVTSTITPNGAKMAGKHGLAMLCVAATQTEGYDALGTNWQVACEEAAKHGRSMDRARLRLVGPMHLAETREQAREDVRYGIQKWTDYFSRVNPAGPQSKLEGKDPAERMIESGRAVIGTPDDAIAMLERLEKKSGGFGTFLLLAHNWATFDKTKKSYELFARHVMPHFHKVNRRRQESLDWYVANKDELMGKAIKAVVETFERHNAEKQTHAGE